MTVRPVDASGPLGVATGTLNDVVVVADPIGRRVIRALDGGAVTNVREFEMPVACVLAGADRRTLVVCVAPDWHREAALRAALGPPLGIRGVVAGTGTP